MKLADGVNWAAAAGEYEESDTEIGRLGWLSRFYKILMTATLWKLFMTGSTRMRFLMMGEGDERRRELGGGRWS